MTAPRPVSAPAAHIAPAVLSPRQFRLATAAVLLLILLGGLDQTIVSVAVPTIARELGALGGMAWVVSGYLIAATVVTPLYGKLGDLYGRRRVLVTAIAIFVLGSIACALAPTLPHLVAARLLQGVGAGGLVALGQAVVADFVPMRERGRFQSHISLVWVAASVVGPIAGGALTQYLSWPWIFWINVPMGVVAGCLVWRSLAALPVARTRAVIDWLGAALLLAGLVALLLPITRMGQGVAALDAANLASFGGAGLLLGVFWRHQRRVATPILPMELLRERAVLYGCMMLFICFFVFIALTVLVPLRQQLVAGHSAAQAGVQLMWLSLAAPATVFVSGRWMHRTGKLRPLQRAGTVLMTCGLGAVAAANPRNPVLLGGALLVVGAGLGLQFATTLIMVQNVVPKAMVGTATALTVFFRSMGGAIGIAVLGSIVLAMLHDGAAAGQGAAAVARQGTAAWGGATPDRPFTVALLAGMVLSLLSVWMARRLPDVRLHAGRSGA